MLTPATLLSDEPHNRLRYEEGGYKYGVILSIDYFYFIKFDDYKYAIIIVSDNYSMMTCW